MRMQEVHLVVFIQDGGLQLHFFVKRAHNSYFLVLRQVKDLCHCRAYRSFRRFSNGIKRCGVQGKGGSLLGTPGHCVFTRSASLGAIFSKRQ